MFSSVTRMTDGDLADETVFDKKQRVFVSNGLIDIAVVYDPLVQKDKFVCLRRFTATTSPNADIVLMNMNQLDSFEVDESLLYVVGSVVNDTIVWHAKVDNIVCLKAFFKLMNVSTFSRFVAHGVPLSVWTDNGRKDFDSMPIEANTPFPKHNITVDSSLAGVKMMYDSTTQDPYVFSPPFSPDTSPRACSPSTASSQPAARMNIEQAETEPEAREKEEEAAKRELTSPSPSTAPFQLEIHKKIELAEPEQETRVKEEAARTEQAETPSSSSSLANEPVSPVSSRRSVEVQTDQSYALDIASICDRWNLMRVSPSQPSFSINVISLETEPPFSRSVVPVYSHPTSSACFSIPVATALTQLQNDAYAKMFVDMILVYLRTVPLTGSWMSLFERTVAQLLLEQSGKARWSLAREWNANLMWLPTDDTMMMFHAWRLLMILQSYAHLLSSRLLS